MIDQVQTQPCDSRVPIRERIPSNGNNFERAALIGTARLIASRSGELIYGTESAVHVLTEIAQSGQRITGRAARWISSKPAPGKRLALSHPAKEFIFTCLRWLDARNFEPASETDTEFIAVLLGVEERSVHSLTCKARHFGLTQRESEILAWVVFGKSSAEIATILGRSTRTIEKHCENSFNKLGVNTRSQAIALLIAAH